MGLILPIDILQDVSLVLVEPIVSTTLTGAVSSVGSQTVSVGSTAGLYVGAVLLVNRGGTSQELITLTAVGLSTITAVFANTHSAGESVAGATFPSGQPDKPLFTVQEMLGYLLDGENDFLLKTRSIYAIQSGIQLVNYNRFYPRPADAIRIERVSDSQGNSLKNTSQESQDLLDYGWEPDTSDFPNRWYEDSIGNSNFGVSPAPDAGGTVNVWYSRKDITNPLTLISQLLVPDVCTHFLKYFVLARAFSKDGEQRDDFRAKYCQSRFDLGVKLIVHFMKGVEILLGQEDEREAEFKQLVVSVG